jgi:hypothetical protein
LDGRAGLAWCTLQAFYEYLIVLKAWELRHGTTNSRSLLRSTNR